MILITPTLTLPRQGGGNWLSGLMFPPPSAGGGEGEGEMTHSVTLLFIKRQKVDDIQLIYLRYTTLDRNRNLFRANTAFAGVLEGWLIRALAISDSRFQIVDRGVRISSL